MTESDGWPGDKPWNIEAYTVQQWFRRRTNRVPSDSVCLNASVLTWLVKGDPRAFFDLIEIGLTPYREVAQHFAAMFPPHTDSSPVYKIRFRKRDGRTGWRGRSYRDPLTARVIAGLELEDPEPLLKMIADELWPQEVSNYLVDMHRDDSGTPYQIEVFSNRRGARPQLHIELRDKLTSGRFDELRQDLAYKTALWEIEKATELKPSLLRRIINRGRKVGEN